MKPGRLTGQTAPAHWLAMGGCGLVKSRRCRLLRAGVCGAAVVGFVLAATGFSVRTRLPPLVRGGRTSVLEQTLRDPAAALRQAGHAREAGALARAEWLYAAIARRHAIVADHAALLRAELLVEQARQPRAVLVIGNALADFPRSPLRGDFHALLGDIRASQQDEPGARQAWTAALDDALDDARRASLRLSIATSLERTGASDEATEQYRTLWRSMPTSPEAVAAEERLVALEAERGHPLREAEDWGIYARSLYGARRNRAALSAFDRALEGRQDETSRRTLSRERARTLFRLRRYREAKSAFSALPRSAEALLWEARSMARSGDVPRAVRAFEALSKEGRGEIPQRALFLAATLLEGKGLAARACSYYERLARRPAPAGLQRAALWRLGWTAYREERFGDAISWFDELSQADDDEIGRLRARYWRARAKQQQGDSSAAAEFEAIAQEFPISYYGWRALDRADVGPQGPKQSVPAGRDRLSPGDLARPRLLLEGGLLPQAHEEIRRLTARVRSLSERLELAQLFTAVEDYHGAQRVIVDAYTEPLARGPIPGLEELWWFAWPDAYAGLISSQTQGPGRVGPELVLSIMREESGYRPQVVSISGARGLLQIMPETGERLARLAGSSGFTPDDLFEPATNIQLGAAYLGQLRRRFPGGLPAAIASYNAGPNAVAKWVSGGRHWEEDEWVEAIPYDQTRSYVKRVLRSLHAYRVLY